jgi:hypothetical protein
VRGAIVNTGGMGIHSSGMGHQEHPLLGHHVIDTETGRTGILRAICPEPGGGGDYMNALLRPPRKSPKAWLAPIGGGREWTTAPSAIQEAPRWNPT